MGNLYAAAGDDQTIYKFAPDGTRTVFVGPSAFGDSAPVDLTFDSAGNLFVSTEGDPGNDTILEFTPDGMESTFATGLTNPRGLAFDGSGYLFAAESNPAPDGDILKFAPGGGAPTVFASGWTSRNSSPSGLRDNGPCSCAALRFLATRRKIYWVFCTRKRLRKDRHRLHDFHEFRSTGATLEINWCKLVNRADGISEIEGEAARVAAGGRGRERVSNLSLAFCSKGRRLRFKRQPQPPDGKCGCRGSLAIGFADEIV